jgi:hypothetical protein
MEASSKLPQKRPAEDTNEETQPNKRQKPNPTGMLKSLISYSSVSPQYVLQQAIQNAGDAKKRAYEAAINKIGIAGIDTFEDYYEFPLDVRLHLFGTSFTSVEHLFRKYDPFTVQPISTNTVQPISTNTVQCTL